MMDQLSSAEQEVAKKAAEADHDMMMASMVGAAPPPEQLPPPVCCFLQICKYFVLQASDNAKEAEDNARKAKSAVKTVLNTITALLDQLGKKYFIVPPPSTNEGSADEAASVEQLLTLLGSSSSGNIDRVDLSKLNEIDESLKNAKGKMSDSDLDRKLAELNDMARTQEDMINDYDRQIREIHADIANLNDIKNTLPEGCFNTPSLERP